MTNGDPSAAAAPDKTPFAAALEAAIQARGVSIEWLRQRLKERGTPLSAATLSYWRSGRSQPEHQASLEALGTLEELLGLGAGELAELRGRSKRPGPRSSREIHDVLDGSEAVRHGLAELGLEEAVLIESSVALTLDFDEVGVLRRIANRSVVRSVADGARLLGWVNVVDHREDPAPVLRTIGGCSLHGRFADPDTGVYVAALEMDRPLALGETAICEFEVAVRSITAEVYFRQGFAKRVTEAVFWLRFHPDHLPRAFAVEELRDERVAKATPVALVGTGAHYVARNFGPGMIALRMTW